MGTLVFHNYVLISINVCVCLFQTARIILDDCDPAVALDNGHQFDDFTCAAETQFLGELR